MTHPVTLTPEQVDTLLSALLRARLLSNQAYNRGWINRAEREGDIDQFGQAEALLTGQAEG